MKTKEYATINQLYSKNDLANEIGVDWLTVQDCIDNGYIVEPTIRYGKRVFWSKQEYIECVKWFRYVRPTLTKHKLPLDTRMLIIKLYGRGWTQPQLAKKYKVNQATISRILNS